jgi:hypothetical protein
MTQKLKNRASEVNGLTRLQPPQFLLLNVFLGQYLAFIADQGKYSDSRLRFSFLGACRALQMLNFDAVNALVRV